MKLNPKHALVVLSGGQDSTTCLGLALDRYETVSTITFDYGQRHAIELRAARDVCNYFKNETGRFIRNKVVVCKDLLESTSPLTSDTELEQYSDHASMEKIIGNRVELTFVPMRNTLFLAIAANYAVAIGAGVIMSGICASDNANYSDCTADFIYTLSIAINSSLGLKHGKAGSLKFESPLLNLTKAQSVKLAMETPYTYDALAFSHTAYDGKYPPTGMDHASVLRAYGFEQAGVPDPLVVRAVNQGLMSWPASANYDNVAKRSPK